MTEVTTSIQGLDGNVPFRWMEAQVAPASEGTYEVVYEINDEFHRSKAKFTGEYWSHDSALLIPLFRYWLFLGEVPAPEVADDAPVTTAFNGHNPVTNSPVQSQAAPQLTLLHAVDVWDPEQEGYEDEWLSDAQVVVYLTALSNSTHTDWFGLIGALDPQGEHVNLGTPDDIRTSKFWAGKVIRDLQDRDFVRVGEGLSVTLTASGMDVVVNGLSDVDDMSAIG